VVAISAARRDATDALLDAAEALLVEVGYAAVTTRKLAERAGVNHGLVHYYFGSMEEVLVQTLERYTARLTARQREMYAASGPFIDKWRQAMAYLDDDLASGYQKIWYELQAMAWNHPEMRSRVQGVTDTWLGVLRVACADAMAGYGLDDGGWPVDAIVSLVATFNQGIILERLVGVDSGHGALLQAIDGWLEKLEAKKRKPRREHPR
jgi:AcrR family transcriptional regulator